MLSFPRQPVTGKMAHDTNVADVAFSIRYAVVNDCASEGSSANRCDKGGGCTLGER